MDVLSTINDRHFTPEDKINYKNDGFNIAAAFTAFDSETEYILDASYGELVFMHYFWGIQENGEYAAGRRRLKTIHNCTQDELGLSEDASTSKFFKTSKQNRDIINTYTKKFVCADESEMEVFGDFNSDNAQLMNIQLIKC